MTRQRVFRLTILSILNFSIVCSADTASDLQLHQAAAKGDLGAVRVLLSNGADIESRDKNGATPLIIAVTEHNTEVAKLLLEKGANVSARDNYDETALTSAAGSFDPDLVRLLLDANPNQKDKNAALFEAAKSGPVIIQSDAPGPTTQQTTKGSRELPWVTIMRLLLNSGANIEARDEEGETPLLRAATYGQTETFKLLVEKGAKINVRDKRGMTPLIAAACACAVATMNSTYDIMKILMDRGAEVNARDGDGRTALMLAASSPDDPASIKLLLSHGADPILKDKKGEMARNYAMKGYRPEKAMVLRKETARSKAHEPSLTRP